MALDRTRRARCPVYPESVHITSDDLTDALREHGMRVTEPRRAICEVLARSHDEHLDAPTIYAKVAAEVIAADVGYHRGVRPVNAETAAQ